MKRKMLISIALIIIMLLNCIMPVFAASAAEGGEIELNSKLYTAVKKSLEKQGISFIGNDITHSISITEENKARVTELNLNEGEISDLTGLENFTNLAHLELSGNNITKDSNLAVLTGLPLKYLDLSTNQLEDVSEIDELINSIKASNGTVILSGQTVTIVNEAIIDVEEASDNAVIAEYTLPRILEKAGYIKSVWIKQSAISENGTIFLPYLEEISNPVTEGNDTMKLRIASDEGNPYKGLFKLEIYIYDDPTEAGSAANLNPAATNILNGSRFYIYVVVHDSDSTAITTEDSNLYKAIKEQLTAGQTINNELDSYPFEVNADGEIIKDECTYTTEGNNLILTIVGEDEPSYILDTETNRVYLYDEGEKGEYYTDKFEKQLISTTDEEGVVTLKEGYAIYHNGANRDLYIQAYDDAKTFVIDNEDLVNKITSLMLNNKEIRDLTGLEKFVGLSSYLNVSHNYLSDIEPIYNLQANKDAFESKIQEKYNYYLTSREYGNLSKSLSETKTNKTAADAEIQNIANAIQEILTKFEEASKIEEYTETQKTETAEDGTETTVTEKTKNENYEQELENKAKEIEEILKNIYGYDTVDEATGKKEHTDGYIEILEDRLNDTEKGVSGLYSYLSSLYNIYNNEHKLATLLTPELNYLDFEQYLTFKDTMLGSAETVRGLVEAEISRLGTLESNQALSELDKDLLSAAFGIDFDSEEVEYPLQEYFAKLMEDTAGSRIYWTQMIDKFREVALYSEMGTYCLIHRMEIPTTAVSQCYCEEYLKQRIKSFEYEGIDVTLEREILNNLEANVTDGNDLYDAFINYMKLTFDYTNVDDSGDIINLPTCSGPYTELKSLVYNTTNYENVDEIFAKLEELEKDVEADDKEVIEVYNKLSNAIIKTINIKEAIDFNEKYQGDLNLYNEVVALSSKFVTNSGEVSIYITLPKLRKLDISYNAYLEGIEKISTLTGLRELYANANYITDITEVDWSAIKYLRKLGLAYNYIPSIKPLENMEYLVDLDASHNMISGKLEFNFTKSQKTLMNLDLSYNQITDITPIMEFLDWKTGGNDGNYLAREDTININLNNQNITLNIEEPIFLSDYPSTIDVDLPKIFTQLLAIDVERTAFGETSQNGRIESEGKYVTLNTRTVGEKEGVVEVIAMSGDGTPVETCVGEGTKATIKYVVKDRTVTSVKVEPSEDVVVKPGETQVFTALVEGEDLLDTSVTWSVLDNLSANTTIAEDGTLTVGEDETAEVIHVMAVSNFDGTKNDVVTVSTIDPDEPIDERIIKVEPSENVVVKPGEEQDFTAEVTGKDVTDTTVTWSVEGNLSANTTISSEGKLVVAEDETAEEIKVIATSNFDNTIKTEVVVAVNKEPEEPTDETVVTVEPSENVVVKPGEEQDFTAEVTGKDVTDTTVTWSVEGNLSANTTISSEGKLVVAEDETAEEIKVIATSNFDNTIKTEVVVAVNKEPEEPTDETVITVEPSENVVVKPGGEQDFTVEVTGTEVTSKEVKWSLSGFTSQDTNISSEGKLTLGADESADEITLTVDVTVNDSIKETKTIIIKVDKGEDPENPGVDLELGYKVEDEYLTEVSPKTPVEDFKTILLDNEEYNVVIKKDGETITSGNVATGMYVQIQDKDGEVVKDENGDLLVYEVVVKGDVNGDGVANSLDSVLIKAYRNEVKDANLIGSAFEAADIDDNGKVDITDSKLLLYHRAEVKGYNLNYKNSK